MKKIIFPTSALWLLLVASSISLHAMKPIPIYGTLLGADGKPLSKGSVQLFRAGARTPFLQTQTGPTGEYSLSADATGLITVRFTGAGHSMYEVPVLVETPKLTLSGGAPMNSAIAMGRSFHIDVKLGVHSFAESFDSVKIVGDFNKFDAASAMPMTKNPDGTYSAILKASGKKFAYQLLMMANVNGTPRRRLVNGTDFTELTADDNGEYRSVVNPRNGTVTITFDPGKLPSGSDQAVLSYVDPATRRLADIVADIDKRTTTLNNAIRQKLRAGEDVGNFTYDWSAVAKDLAERIKKTGNMDARRELMIDYLTLATQTATNLDSGIARMALAAIPPTSGLWSIEPEALGATLELAGPGATSAAYRKEAVDQHGDTAVRLNLVMSDLEAAATAKNDAEVRRLLGYMSKAFPSRNEVKYAMASYNPDRAIKIGRPVPNFEVASLENPSVKLSNATMKGRYYLIDFWATWCGPCVGEMGNLHKAYEKYHGRNFEIVSLSFDAKPGDIAGFRGKKWKMPWLHGFVEGNFQSDLAKRFEVLGIPKPILVDVSGNILAAGDELRGDGLDKTLARVLGTAN
ncbi:MAG: thioredoxin-like domain-containing protein [Candidatus Kapaibacterium sp.]